MASAPVVKGKDNPTDPIGRENWVNWGSSWGGLFLTAYFATLAFGMAHSVDAAIPAFGYLYVVFFTFVAHNIVGTAINPLQERIKKFAKLVIR